MPSVTGLRHNGTQRAVLARVRWLAILKHDELSDRARYMLACCIAALEADVCEAAYGR